MTLTLKVDEFGTLARSRTLEDTIREPDFMKRAIRLFNLRETVWSAFSRTTREIEEETEKYADETASGAGWAGFAIGGVGAALGVIVLAGTAPFMLGVAAVGGLVAGFITACITDAVVRNGPETEGEEAQKIMEASRKTMAERIEAEIVRMDNDLFSQTSEIREEFRSAFKHAATKQEIRETRIHRAKMEQEAEETADAAQTAATMATIAAVNTSIASMSRK